MTFCTVPDEPEGGGLSVLHVSEVSRIICEVLDDERLQNIWVKGEITNYTHHHRGHRYFSLSEQVFGQPCLIPCTMWRRDAGGLGFEPESGMEVLVRGSVDVYEPQGRYQFIVREMRQAGAGEKHLLVERWKNELAAEGLFSPERKIALPKFPRRIGIVTSASGAALHDILQVIGRRFPLEILLSPAAVQGEYAHAEIAAAIRKIDGLADVIIVGRGGGSFEDLFPFNHPDVVRAIAACRTPVVSAVGHEVDVTLSDHAADVRAPTPSAAAELVVPDRSKLAADLKTDGARMENALLSRIERAWRELEDFRARLHPRRLQKRIGERMQDAVDLGGQLDRAIRSRMERERFALGELAAMLEGKNPFYPLSRGYCLVRRGDAVITSARDLAPGDRLAVEMADGESDVMVEEVRLWKHDMKTLSKS